MWGARGVLVAFYERAPQSRVKRKGTSHVKCFLHVNNSFFFVLGAVAAALSARYLLGVLFDVMQMSSAFSFNYDSIKIFM